MKRFKWITAATMVVGLLACFNLSAHGRIDAGPIYVHLDVLESNKSIEKVDLEGFRADGYFQVYSGLIFKPAFTVATGHGKYQAGTLALGFYLPMGQLVPALEGLSVMPQAGWTASRLSTELNLAPPRTPGSLSDVKEIFRSSSEFIGLEATYQLLQNVSVSGSVLYGWSNTRTTWTKEPFGELIPREAQKSSSKGFSYSAMVDYQLTDLWSINLAGVYNLMLSKEKHGIRACGFRLGCGYCW